jgi:hypothetical protein
VPAGDRVGVHAEVYDSKEFREHLKSSGEKATQSIYKFSQNTGNHLHSLGVLHRKNDLEGVKKRHRPDTIYFCGGAKEGGGREQQVEWRVGLEDSSESR